MNMALPAPLVVPRRLANGRVVFADAEAEISDRLRNGDPTLGWEGDPALKLVRNIEAGRWEVWRTAPDRTDVLVCTRAGDRFPGRDLIAALVKADSRRHDRIAQIEAKLAAEVAEAQREDDEWSTHVADKFAFALGRDLGMPAQHGRPYALGAPHEPPAAS